MPSSESSCVLDRCYQDRINICTHTHNSLSCGASCPDCVNPLCPPHISLHPSTSTLLWWRHTHTRILSIIIIVSAGEESALLFVITGVWCEREEFSRREKRMDGKEKKERAGQKKTHQYVCDILVTFYRNCCSTPSHTCKKGEKRNTLGMCFAVDGFQGFVWCVLYKGQKELCGWLVWL